METPKTGFLMTRLIFNFQGDALCKDCFYYAFEEEIHKTIIDAKLFTQGETIAIGASGGKGTGQTRYTAP